MSKDEERTEAAYKDDSRQNGSPRPLMFLHGWLWKFSPRQRGFCRVMACRVKVWWSVCQWAPPHPWLNGAGMSQLDKKDSNLSLLDVRSTGTTPYAAAGNGPARSLCTPTQAATQSKFARQTEVMVRVRKPCVESEKYPPHPKYQRYHCLETLCDTRPPEGCR